MIKINKSVEPNCLTELKIAEDTTYNDLRDECRDIVQEQLSNDQNGLCAYCQRSFESIVFIEHYVPQSSGREDLDYSNFLGVCSGNYYIDRKSGNKIRFCSAIRGDLSITINPLNEDHIDSIYYDDDNKIHSNNREIDGDLEVRLHLNFEELCFDREMSLDEELEQIEEMAIEMKIPNIEAYRRGIQSVSNRNPPFTGFVLYRLREKLDYYLKKNE